MSVLTPEEHALLLGAVDAHRPGLRPLVAEGRSRLVRDGGEILSGVTGRERLAPLIFRPAATVDAPAVASLIESGYRGEESKRGWTTEADLIGGQRTNIEAITEIITAPESHMFLAEADGQLVGCCHVEARADCQAYLGMLTVRPGLQAQGVGRALVAKAEHEARVRWGATGMRLQVIRQRSELIAWYERLGYRLTGDTLPFAYDDPGVITNRNDLEFVVLTKPI
jgi:ribosomal protein S18 acetylase RimI-like enzyme